MDTNRFFSILVSLVVAFFASTAFGALRCEGLADSGAFNSPSELGDAIAESLTADPSGNGQIRGANISPNGYLKGVQQIKPEVTLESLVGYLKGLTAGEMPKGEVHLSRACGGEIDTATGNWRQAKPGERGWYDPDGTFVLAGDCTNTFLDAISIVIDDGVRPEQLWVPPAPVSLATSCPLIITAMIYDNSGLVIPSVSEQLADENNAKPRPEGVAQEVLHDGDGSESYRISRGSGAELQKSANKAPAGEEILVHHVFPDNTMLPIFKGMVQGERRIPMPLDFNKSTDRILVRVARLERFESTMRNGLWIWGKELEDCGTNKFSMVMVQ